MSHVTTIDIEIRDLDSLAAACDRCGLELVRDQKTYHWYGESVGDTALPAGFTVEDLGKCDHAIRVKPPAAGHEPIGKNGDKPYEIGVVRRRDGRPGFTLHIDEWCDGFGLIALCGKGGDKLKQLYATTVATKTAVKQGYRVREQAQADGSIRLLASK